MPYTEGMTYDVYTRYNSTPYTAFIDILSNGSIYIYIIIYVLYI